MQPWVRWSDGQMLEGVFYIDETLKLTKYYDGCDLDATNAPA